MASYCGAIGRVDQTDETRSKGVRVGDVPQCMNMTAEILQTITSSSRTAQICCIVRVAVMPHMVIPSPYAISGYS